MIATYGAAALHESSDLIRETFGRGVVVVIPVGHNGAPRETASEVALLPDLPAFFNVHHPDPWILGNEVPHVLAVGQDQEFFVWIGLELEAPDRLGEPLPAIAS